MRIQKLIKENYIILVLIIIIPILISQIIRIPLGRWTIAAEGDWVSFLGSYGGGIIGGIVAFLVARNQATKQNLETNVRNLAKELPILTAINIELEKILQSLNNVNEECIVLEIDKESYKIVFDALKWDRWDGIHMINDPVLQEELIKHNEALKRNIDVFEIDVNALLDSVKQKSHLEKRMNPLDPNYVKVVTEISEEQSYLQMIQKDKEYYLKELPYCIEKTDKIINGIVKRKEKIHQILTENNYFNDLFLSSLNDYKVER